MTQNQSTILTPEASEFLAALHREFEPRRRDLLTPAWRDRSASRLENCLAFWRRPLRFDPPSRSPKAEAFMVCLEEW